MIGVDCITGAWIGGVCTIAGGVTIGGGCCCCGVGGGGGGGGSGGGGGGGVISSTVSLLTLWITVLYPPVTIRNRTTAWRATTRMIDVSLRVLIGGWSA